MTRNGAAAAAPLLALLPGTQMANTEAMSKIFPSGERRDWALSCV